MNNEMNKAIEKRLVDGSWDSMIAGAVIKKRRKRRMLIASSTAALAASITLAILFVLDPFAQRNNTNTLNAFINKQIEETYKEAITVKTKAPAEKMNIDSLIDDSLTQRGI